MLRTTVGTLDALLGGNALQRGIARVGGAPGKQIWIRKISTGSAPSMAPWHHRTTNPALAAQTWTQRFGAKFVRPARKSRLAASPASPKRPFHSSRPRRAKEQTSAEGNAGKTAAADEPTTLSARLKKLTREYGWAAVGVYFGLSALDFPFCFLFVRMVGADRIGAIEHAVVSRVSEVIPENVKSTWNKYRQAIKWAEKEEIGSNKISEDVEMVGIGVKEAEEKHQAQASLATQLALAYAIHKSFIFIRVPLTAVVTPKVVQILRRWGWQIGKRAV